MPDAAKPFPMNRRHFLTLALGAGLAGAGARGARAEASRDGIDIVGTIVILAPFNISVVRRGKVRAIMTLVTNLDIGDAMLRDRISHELPVLRDAYLRCLDPYVDRLDLRQTPDVVRLTQVLQRMTDGLYGKGETRVLVTHATLRRLA
ncbi:hypothetical protein L2U69_08600 [Zavarzinia compransoris]|uniref:hypothetical protein n=1 Tax=Zavarzinia marina TaxID=2911065 RepID=UPI001F34EE1B|nr:hypothetical protein [Zavarzinia marina]MCF4165700.1 hypothetical protein [Zavarzinia marina]